MDTEKTYSFSFTPDNPEKLKQLFDSLRRNASVVAIKTVSGTEEPDRIIFNGSSYSKRNECKRIPDYYDCANDTRRRTRAVHKQAFL